MMPSLGHNSTYREFLPEMHNLNLIIKTHQTNPNQGIIYKTTDLLFSKMPMSKKTKYLKAEVMFQIKGD